MSEYQYYEFRAIDRSLTEKQQSIISALSSRAHVTSYKATFVYNYGDFRGNPEQLMRDYFDAMVYMANWGSRRLMFRIPLSLIDTKKAGLYCITDEIDAKATQGFVVLDMNFHDEELAEWTEGEGWLDELVGLRDELIQGDFRVLYLAWLKAAENALGFEGIDDDTPEPPVPPGLNQLSGALKTFVSFLGIDEAALVVAAQKSMASAQRTIGELIHAAAEWRKCKQEENLRKEELVRKRRLEELAVKENEVWQQVEALIKEKKPKSYDNALDLLKDLRELAEYQGKLEKFKDQIAEIQQTYSSRPALRSRILHAKLI